MAGATTARVDRVMEVLVVKDRVMAALVPMALRGADQVDREIVGPMAVDLIVVPALVAPADPMVEALAPMVLAVADQDVVNVPVSLAEAAAEGAEAASSSGWIRLTASLTKSSARLSL